jgi:hypothetical protein
VPTFPYHSQWGTVRATEEVVLHDGDPAAFHDWRADGFADADEFRFWARHVCGLACLRSVLATWRGESVPMPQLLAGAREAGALVLRGDDDVGGLYYRPFLEWIGRAYGIRGRIVENTGVDELTASVGDDAVAIVSVSPEIRWPERPNARRGGHLVLVHERAGDSVTFHNPSGVTGCSADVRLPVDVVGRFAAGRGMILHR